MALKPRLAISHFAEMKYRRKKALSALPPGSEGEVFLNIIKKEEQRRGGEDNRKEICIPKLEILI